MISTAGKDDNVERLPHVLFDVKAWLTDGKVRTLTPAMRGWWMDLIAWAWFKGEEQYKIPKDYTRIAEDLHITTTQAEKIIAALQGGRYGPILEERDGYYIVKRLRVEKEKLLRKSDKARHSAHARWKTLPQEILDCVELLLISVKECTPRQSPFLKDEKKLEKWKAKAALAIDKMHRLDDVPIDDIKATIYWIQHDQPKGNFPGWGAVVLSGDKLREKYHQILVQMENGNGRNGKEKLKWPEGF